jgi:nitrogenase molybdenum-cofactor synthesis protein NifE
MMVCSRAMINVARKMEERYGIPYFEGSFYGIGDMSDTLRNIARLLVERGAPDDIIARTEAVIAREEKKAWAAIASYRERLQGKKVLLFTGGVKSWSVVAALQEGGMEVVGTSVKKSTKEDKERIKEIMGEDAHMFDDLRPREMYKILKEARADIMLSGGRSQFIALKAKMPWLDINQERHYAYAGYEGMVALVREIDKTLSNPVWAQVRSPAPWDEVSWEERADEANAAEAEAAAESAEPEGEARKAKSGKRICDCMEVDEATIEAAIRNHKLLRVEDVRAHTKASGGCGSCAPRIAKILKRINGVKVPAFEQTPAPEVANLPSPQPSPTQARLGELAASKCPHSRANADGRGSPAAAVELACPLQPHPLADAVTLSGELAKASSLGEGQGEGDSAATPTKAA